MYGGWQCVRGENADIFIPLPPLQVLGERKRERIEHRKQAMEESKNQMEEEEP